jgi:hypothetical protein
MKGGGGRPRHRHTKSLVQTRFNVERTRREIRHRPRAPGIRVAGIGGEEFEVRTDGAQFDIWDDAADNVRATAFEATSGSLTL